MHKIIINILYVFAFSTTLFAQNEGVFYLSDGVQSVFAFDSEPTFLSISNNDIKVEQKANNILLGYYQYEDEQGAIVQHTYDNTVLVVEIESEYYSIHIVHTDDKSEVDYFVDFRQQQLNSNKMNAATADTREMPSTESNKNIMNDAVLTRVTERIKSFENSITESSKIISHNGTTNGFQAKLISGFVDDDHYYFKLRLTNNNSLNYNLNAVRIHYKTKLKKAVSVNPTHQSDISSVKAKQTLNYYIAIPQFPLDKKGRLKISFYEHNGMRDVEVTIPSDKIDHQFQYLNKSMNITQLSK